ISSVIVGGGNSRFITDGTYDGINIKALSPQYLSRLNFPSDAVIMLGCLKKVDLPDHVFSTYPHYDELMSTKIDPLNDLSNHVEVIKKKYGFSGDLQFEKKFVKDVQFVAANKFENGQKTTLGYFYQTNEDELVPILSKFGEVDILQKLASVAFNRSDFEFTSKPALIPTQSHLDYINWNGKGDAKKRYYICLNHLNF
ncbi:MAG: hypothetical protein JHC93_07980, partial [Parachlamydiales bacterium]|nr:hypothetical protein [Parachlamydiales bacterium]